MLLTAQVMHKHKEIKIKKKLNEQMCNKGEWLGIKIELMHKSEFFPQSTQIHYSWFRPHWWPMKHVSHSWGIIWIVESIQMIASIQVGFLVPECSSEHI